MQCDMALALAEEFDIPPEYQNQANIEKRVARVMYKYTTCGVVVQFLDKGMAISGYCEGYDGSFDAHILLWPFTMAEMYAAADRADEDGEHAWNDTHGCSQCAEHAGLNPEYPAPVWPECPACGGDGIII